MCIAKERMNHEKHTGSQAVLSLSRTPLCLSTKRPPGRGTRVSQLGPDCLTVPKVELKRSWKVGGTGGTGRTCPHWSKNTCNGAAACVLCVVCCVLHKQDVATSLKMSEDVATSTRTSTKQKHRRFGSISCHRSTQMKPLFSGLKARIYHFHTVI